MSGVHDYWRQFMHTVSFAEPCKVEGTVEARSQDGPRDGPYPVLVLRTDSGYKLKVNVTQTRLLSELVRLGPDIGDRLTIVYHGPAPKAPPGMSPTKEFSVSVERKDPPSPAGPGQMTSGEGTRKRPGMGP